MKKPKPAAPSRSASAGRGTTKRDEEATPGTLDAKRAATRQRVLEEATTLFSRYGFRRTSVDELAAAAGVAKPTLYAYFPDKDALFLAVCEHVLDQVLVAAEKALREHTSLTARVSAVLAAKFTFLFELVDSSPHASELLGSSNRIAAAKVEEVDRRIEALLRGELARALDAEEISLARAGVSLSKLVEVLMRCGHGASFHAADSHQHRRQLDEMVLVVLASVKVNVSS